MDSSSRNPPRVSNELKQARASYAERAWAQAFELFSALDRDQDASGGLTLDDLERLAVAAGLTGRDAEFLATLERAHAAALLAGESRRAGHAAFWSVLRLTSLNETGRASGWFERLRRLAEQAGEDSLEHCYLQVPLAFMRLKHSDFDEAARIAGGAAALAARLGDADLQAFTRCLEGRSRLRQGKTNEGLALLDECMLSVTCGAVSDMIAALVYCTVIACCHDVYAFERAREWTEALAAWCEAQPDLVAFRGVCMVHRAEISRLAGDWPRAAEQAERASAGVPGHQNPESVGDAYYELGEIHRLRGQLPAAELAYTEAGRHGREPHPGIALLRLAQGQAEAAVAGMRRALGEVRTPLGRAKLLPAAIETLLAAAAHDEALEACRELEQIALDFGTEALVALAAHARAALFLHVGDAQAALGPLRRAFWIWQKIGAPHATAKIRVDLARACDALGDRAGAALERDAARATFAELGATLDLERIDAPRAAAKRPPAHGLSDREFQVLRLVATGGTNKLIASELCLSEKTIDRHVSNIFAKLGVSSRTAATAYAYEHGLISP